MPHHLFFRFHTNFRNKKSCLIEAIGRSLGCPDRFCGRRAGASEHLQGVPFGICLPQFVWHLPRRLKAVKQETAQQDAENPRGPAPVG